MTALSVLQIKNFYGMIISDPIKPVRIHGAYDTGPNDKHVSNVTFLANACSLKNGVARSYVTSMPNMLNGRTIAYRNTIGSA